jgi:hypothetical protein
MNLLETYKNRLAVSDSVHAKAHMGESMSNFKKIAVAKCLDNVSKFMNEAFENSVGTQRADLGAFKKFALNLTTVALPNLIAFDLVIVQPMTSISGYITYLQYTAGTNKGATKQGDVLNDPFRLGKVDPTYTSERVVETVKVNAEGKATLAWAPVVNTDEVKPEVVGAEGITLTVTDKETGAITLAGTGVQENAEFKIRYVYDNVVIPQNDLPLINVEMQSIALVAKARRVAVYYSQIAAYQAKTDYGFDLADQIAEKAVGQLSYEIDTEITQLLIDNASSDQDLVWSKTLPTGVSKTEHYEGFTEILEVARQRIYDRTKRFAPNYMLIASNVLPILTFIKGFTAAPTANINGPYFAGTLNSLKVFVTPNIEPGKFVIGVNGNDMMSSAAVYAPYMAVVPTQLLQFADGGNSQGWSTMYDLKLLNKELLIAGRVTA